MFLIQIDDTCFIDAEKVCSMSIYVDKGNKCIDLCLTGVDCEFYVSDKYQEGFINNINALDNNFGISSEHLFTQVGD